ncbi:MULTISPECIES: phasin family protein [Ectothiorhodospira]|uniref:phasin family protein n=1 Tax=Ectothiorhodospira TaxID=1051 RepID=UPI00024A84CC|nr:MULTISPECIES: phasin family protein [Ectothiorhodospira]EHQ51687.1 phasin family protein [Ectothiorhodospira sp. PHS-1]MCG5512982.1 phasin family protein [Ectothiorhodospira shaposhnikovii]
MYNEFFNMNQEQFEKMAGPVRKFNNATLDHVAKLVEYQISMFRSYSEITIEQMRALQTVTDPKSLQAYVSAQAEATKSLSEKVAKDTNELVELQRGYAEEVQKLSEEGLATVTSIEPAKARKSA